MAGRPVSRQYARQRPSDRPAGCREGNPVPRLRPRRADHDDALLRATLSPFVCTWEDLPRVQAARSAATSDAPLVAQLVALGGLLLWLTTPIA